jgi:hypothetical protein
MTKKEVKRLLALLKAQAEYPDREIEIDLPEGFKESFEGQKYFRGWINYHETWDVNAADVWVVIPRKVSLTAEWHRELARVIPVITPTGRIVEAVEWDRKSALTK